eukprot:Skav223170  [mRNA]  locus=scaffold2044:73716:81635:+ [translate_table: standard]
MMLNDDHPITRLWGRSAIVHSDRSAAAAQEWIICVTAHGAAYFTAAESRMSNLLDTFIVWACVLMIFLTVLTFGIISVDIIGPLRPLGMPPGPWTHLWTPGRDEGWGLAASGTAAWYFQNGIIQASMTMSRFIFSDNAVDFIEELQVQQPYIWIYCFLFMAISAYVILNLVTAVICDKAQQIVNDNEAEKLFEMRMEEKRNMKDLKHLGGTIFCRACEA